MTGPLVLDTWAFVEELRDGPHRADLDARRKGASRVVTTGQALVESYTFILRTTKRPSMAREWWDLVREGRLVVLEPSLDEVDRVLAEVPRGVGFSLVDASVAWAARHERVAEVATGDREFLLLGLQPLFA